jgi:hypothetical protein
MTTVVIMPGGFHPFHAGHLALYQSAQRAFPDAEVFVAATNDTSSRPFPFAVKEKLAKLAGVEAGHFVQVKSPFRAEEITSRFDPDQDVLIFVRSEKDAGSPPQPGGVKKDGSATYLQPLLGAQKLEPFAQHAYMAYLPTVEFGPGMTSATEIRTAWPTLNDQRKTALIMSLYPAAQKNPRLAATVVKLLDAAIGSEQGVAEGEKQSKSKEMDLDWHYKNIINTKGLSDKAKKDTTDIYNKLKKKKEQGVAEGSLEDRLKKYVRPVVKTTPKIERTTNPAGRTTDHVEWKVTGPMGDVNRFSSKKAAQAHYDSFSKPGADSLKEFAPGDGDDGENPLDDYPCYDCGSTIYLHHTRLCDLAEPDAVRDLPAEPGSQHWTGRVPKGLTPIPGLGKSVEETVSANGTIANTSGAGAGMTASYQRRENQPVAEDYLDERRL